MNTRVRVTGIPVLLAASLGINVFGRTLAQEATAAAKPTGFDEITLKVEEAGVTGMPDSVAAGRYLVNVSGPEPGEMGPSGAVLLQLPEGKTPEEAFQDVQSAQNEPPSWYLEAHFGGGVVLTEGTESWAIIDLAPGTWIVTTPFGSTLGVQFDVTGDMPADLEDPASNVQIELGEMVIHVKEGEFVAGDNVVAICNIGAQLHFVDISKVPDGTTEDDINAMMQFEMTGTPTAGGLTQEDFVSTGYFPEVSPGVCQFQPITLEAGTYFLACWVPDMTSGMPHAMMGMWTLVTVK